MAENGKKKRNGTLKKASNWVRSIPARVVRKHEEIARSSLPAQIAYLPLTVHSYPAQSMYLAARGATRMARGNASGGKENLKRAGPTWFRYATNMYKTVSREKEIRELQNAVRNKNKQLREQQMQHATRHMKHGSNMLDMSIKMLKRRQNHDEELKKLKQEYENKLKQQKLESSRMLAALSDNVHYTVPGNSKGNRNRK